MVRARALGWLAALLALGCGGLTTTGSGAGGASGNTPDDPPPASAGGGGTSADPNDLPAGVALPPCVPGFSPAKDPSRPCAFLGNDLCYDTKLAACACVCPRAHDSTCVSPFVRSPNARARVDCF